MTRKDENFWTYLVFITSLIIYFNIFGFNFISVIFCLFGTFIVAMVMMILILIILGIWDSIGR